MKKAILFLVIAFSTLGNSQTNFVKNYVIDNTIKNVKVFKSKDFGWTFVATQNSPYRYFYRENDSSDFIEFFDKDNYLEYSRIGFNGFNGNEYTGDKYGATFIPSQDGFITSYYKYSENAAVIRVYFSSNSVFRYESASTPLKEIKSFFHYDQSLYFNAASTDLFTAIYKFIDGAWETTSGNPFFDDYELRSVAYDETNNRIICSTGLTYMKDGLWNFKGGNGYAEIESNNPSGFKLDKMLGYIYTPTDKGKPVFSGKMINDTVGNELYILNDGTITLNNDASIPGVFGTSFKGTVFNDRFDLLFSATIYDMISPTNQIISKFGNGVYMLNFESHAVDRIVNNDDNIISVVSAVRNKDGIYLVGTSTYDTYNVKSKYYVYLLENQNPNVTKIDLGGEYLESNFTKLFVSDDIIYFTTNKGICKIQNRNFTNFYNTTTNFYSNEYSILMVEANKIYLNDNNEGFVVVSPESQMGINEDMYSANKVSIFPNPASTVLNIQLSNNSVINKLVITDLTGKKILEQDGNATTINIENLAQGMYILKTTIEDKTITKKFVKQ